MADDLVRQAERIVLGSMMLDPAVIEPVADIIRANDFADLRHGSVFAAVTANAAGGADTNATGVAVTLLKLGELKRVGGTPYLHDLIAAVPTTVQATYYARIVADAAAIRAAAVEATRLGQIVAGGNLDQIAAEKTRLIAAWSASTTIQVVDTATELDEFLGGADPDHDWLVPNVIERHDRVVVTGPEGGGKSTLLRQVGVQTAAGIHPFTGDWLDPLCVLIVDLENSRTQVRRELRPLRLAAGDRYHAKPGLHIRVRPEGINLLDDGDGRWLLDLTGALRPDLLITGPTYKMAHGDPTEEQTARTVTAWLDRIRAATGAALIIEAHSPHGAGGARRPIRPYGASLWLRWPEFGIHLADDGQLQHWRGPRDERDWPAALRRGGDWPWTPVVDVAAVRWARIVDLCTKAGGQLSERDLAGMLGVSDSTVHRLIGRHRAEWDSFASPQATGGASQ